MLLRAVESNTPTSSQVLHSRIDALYQALFSHKDPAACVVD